MSVLHLIMGFDAIKFLKTNPLIRLLAGLIAGILLQQYLQLPLMYVLIASIIICMLLVFFAFANTAIKYSYNWLQGLLILLLFVLFGSAVVYVNTTSNSSKFIGAFYKPEAAVKVTIQEPLVAKQKSYKAVASADALLVNGNWQKVKGNVLIYFKKTDANAKLHYGSQIIFYHNLQPITNSGNPAAFDYKRYNAFQDIYYQTYLQQNDYIVLANDNENSFKRWIFSLQRATINTLQQNIPGKTEHGVAEALLIGYRNDLDKELVQSYSNTGVVHIIAISGLHIGMIYWLLLQIFKPFKDKSFNRWVKPLLILFILWTFSLVAGAVPSIMRSTVMFSFIVIGDTLGRRHQIYNTLAASALCMLSYNPFFLWDVGFQLSYAAVVSIIALMKPIYRQLYIKNKSLDKLWQLSSVTLAAQIFTLPLVLYYFHRFPNYFLLANFIVVPLSGLILYSELVLLVIAKFSWLALLLGKAVEKLIWFMNSFVQNTEQFPYAVTDGIKITALQAYFLYAVLILFAVWLMLKNKKAFIYGLCFFVLLLVIRAVDIFNNRQHDKLIVYNIPRQAAIDLMQNGNHSFFGDTSLEQDNYAQNFHLKPSRIYYRSYIKKIQPDLVPSNNIISTHNKTFVILNHPISNKNLQEKIKADGLIISQNARLFMDNVASVFDCNEIIFDSSNPAWKIAKWKKDCERLHLRFYSVPEQGAYIAIL